MIRSCRRVSCGPPPSVSHAIALGHSFLYDDYVFYKCDAGFDMFGNNQLHCSAAGRWRGSLPRCEMTSCGNVPVIVHATTLVTSTTFGSKASYVCNDGYVLRGAMMVECIADGLWHPMEETECVAIDCGSPPFVQFSSSHYNSSAFEATVRYQCDVGYRLVGGDDALRCDEAGAWSGALPSCLPVRFDARTQTNTVCRSMNITILNMIQHYCREVFIFLTGARHRQSQ